MSELFQASQEVSVADPAPAPESPLHFLSPNPPRHPIPSSRHPEVALAAALPGRFIYLFCTNGVAADSFSPGLKREKRREKD